MRIDIEDDAEGLNWLNWGTLVRRWILGDATRPATVEELREQLRNANVEATVAGNGDRPVDVLDYPDDPEGPLVIMLPTAQMLAPKWAMSVRPGPYNMPKFYDLAYEGPVRKNLSQPEAEAFALRRIGEYTVNECC